MPLICELKVRESSSSNRKFNEVRIKKKSFKIMGETISRLGQKIIKPVKLKTHKPARGSVKHSIKLSLDHLNKSLVYSPSNSLMRSKML